MKAVIANHKPGTSKTDLTEALRREETNRGLTFEYCLITAGTSLNRAPSEQVWGEGDILSLDSGGNYHGYIGDVCRMAIHGEPDAELEEFVDSLATRIASFDKRAIGETKRFVDVASLPPDYEIAPEWDVCFASIMRPAAQKRINKLMEQGFHKPGDVENRLGYYVGQVGRQASQ